MTDFVLVHGAWHGGWCWKRTADLLRRDGHVVHCPTLTGLGERAHLYHSAIDLSHHIEDVVREIEWHDLDDLVLCGHSYGGMVVTGVADRIPERVAALVYLDAFLPRDGQALSDISGFLPGDQPIPPRSAESLNVGAADRDWVDAKTTPQPPRTFIEPLKFTGGIERVPRRAYVLATLAPAPFLTAAYEHARSRAGWACHTIECGHDVMIDRPAEVAEILRTV